MRLQCFIPKQWLTQDFLLAVTKIFLLIKITMYRVTLNFLLWDPSSTTLFTLFGQEGNLLAVLSISEVQLLESALSVG